MREYINDSSWEEKKKNIMTYPVLGDAASCIDILLQWGKKSPPDPIYPF